MPQKGARIQALRERSMHQGMCDAPTPAVSVIFVRSLLVCKCSNNFPGYKGRKALSLLEALIGVCCLHDFRLSEGKEGG